MKAKIVFFGSSEFSARVLAVLFENFSVAAVVTRADQPVGRAATITSTPAAILAEKLNLKLLKPQKLNTAEFLAEIASLKPDLFLVVAYGKIIPQALLDIPKQGALNIHGSLLPKYRGAAPIHAALLNGETTTGITVMLMDAQMDHGPILRQREIKIGATDTFIELENKLAELAGKSITADIQKFTSGQLKSQPQNHGQATFTKIVSKEDGKIDWNRTAQEIFNQYRAYIAWPGVWTTFDSQILKITKCALAAAETSAKKPGEVFQSPENKILVKCGGGSVLEILELQLAGKKTTQVKDFLNGHKNFVGSTLI